MPVLSDKWISKMAKEADMINPFVETQKGIQNTRNPQLQRTMKRNRGGQLQELVSGGFSF